MVNAQRARTYMTMCEREFGCRAVAPHAYLPYLLDDSNPEERALALSFGASLLALCDRLVIYGDRISSGMKEEIRRGCRTSSVRYLMERITNDRKNRCENRQPII